MDFLTFLNKAQSGPPPKHLIALDPGETTGYAVFVGGELKQCGELDTETLKVGLPAIQELIDQSPIEWCRIVYEDYRIYSWKTEQHTWSGLHTPKLIGGIEALAYVKGIPTFTQMAQVAKTFCTDEKLRTWGLYQKGQRHARDAIRHGCYYQLFKHKGP